MSISTASIASCSFSSCGSDRRQDSQLVRTGWRKELMHRVNTFTGLIDDFITTFVPASSDPPAKDNDPNLFVNWTPQKGKEEVMYPFLLDACEDLTSDLPEGRELTFSDCSSHTVRFPFDDHTDHFDTKPDIVVSMPSIKLPRVSTKLTWQQACMVMEAKATEDQDPFDKRGQVHINTITQLAISARNLFFAHGFLNVFVVGFYGDIGRIARFDHSSAVVSEPFNYRQRPQVLRRFFWRLVHPCVGQSVVGCDPAVRNLTQSDIKWVKKQLEILQWGTAVPEDTDLAKGRQVVVPETNTPDAPTRNLILFDVLDINARLFSRATMVWLALEDTRQQEHNSSTPSLLVLKEAWRQIVRRPEREFYERLSLIPDDKRTGLPKMLFGADLGTLESQEWKAQGGTLPLLDKGKAKESSAPAPPEPVPTPKDSLTPNTPPPSEGPSAVAPSGEAPDNTPSPSTTPTGYPLPYPQYETQSWRLLFGEEFAHRERSLVRFVVDAVGRPLKRFRSTHELVAAIRDAIKGHEQAWEVGVLHRDVSVGNVLIAEEPKDRLRGFLHDFDYSSMTKSTPVIDEAQSESMDPLLRVADEYDDDGKERTGTYYYIAGELLEVPGTIHTVWHDIESFYWLFLWIILRCTHHDLAYDEDPCELMFVFGSDGQAANLKRGWVTNRTKLTVKDNAPLTDLHAQFKALCKRIYLGDELGYDLPTHADVLEIFDAALARTDWPTESDAAVKFVRKKAPNTIYLQHMKRRTETRDIEETEQSSGKRSKTTSADQGGAKSKGGRSSKKSGAGSKAGSRRKSKKPSGV